jgi:hypothetical protein
MGIISLCIVYDIFVSNIASAIFISVDYSNKCILFCDLPILFTTKKSLDSKIPRCQSRDFNMVLDPML